MSGRSERTSCDRELLAEAGIASEGIYRRPPHHDSFDSVVGRGWPDRPSPTPVFVVTHEAPEAVPRREASTPSSPTGSGTALHQAKAAAGDKNVCGDHRADIVREFIRGGAGGQDRHPPEVGYKPPSIPLHTGTAHNLATVRVAGRARDPACPRPTRP